MRYTIAAWPIPWTVASIVVFSWLTPSLPSGFDVSRDPALQRLLGHVTTIASTPHPIGSHENRRVATYIVSQLRSFGFEPIEYEFKIPAENQAFLQASKTLSAQEPNLLARNIVVRKQGTNRNGRCVALVAHYDSVAAGPGAADNAAAVAALIEVFRDLSSSRPENDIVGIFTDGEEYGQAGAAALAGQGALIDNIGLLLNFDARGSKGPVLMFQTSRRYDAFLAGLAQADGNVAAFSISSVVYARMPNRTDFSTFTRAGVTGMNFAIIDGASHYHSPTDTVDNLDKATLRQIGSLMSTLTTYYGNHPLTVPSDRQFVYFSIPPGRLVYFDTRVLLYGGFGMFLCGIVGLSILARRKVISCGTVARNAGVLLLTLIFFSSIAWWAPRYVFPAVGIRTGSFAIIGIIWVGVFLSAYVYLRRRAQFTSVLSAIFLLWILAAAICGAALPHLAHIFLFPAVLGGIPFFITERNKISPLGTSLSVGLPILCAVILFVPILYLVSLALRSFPSVLLVPASLPLLLLIAWGDLAYRVARNAPIPSPNIQ